MIKCSLCSKNCCLQLLSPIFFGLPITRTFFRFPLKVRVIESRLYFHSVLLHFCSSYSYPHCQQLCADSRVRQFSLFGLILISASDLAWFTKTSLSGKESPLTDSSFLWWIFFWRSSPWRYSWIHELTTTALDAAAKAWSGGGPGLPNCSTESIASFKISSICRWNGIPCYRQFDSEALACETRAAERYG